MQGHIYTFKNPEQFLMKYICNFGGRECRVIMWVEMQRIHIRNTYRAVRAHTNRTLIHAPVPRALPVSGKRGGVPLI